MCNAEEEEQDDEGKVCMRKCKEAITNESEVFHQAIEIPSCKKSMEQSTFLTILQLPFIFVGFILNFLWMRSNSVAKCPCDFKIIQINIRGCCQAVTKVAPVISYRECLYSNIGSCHTHTTSCAHGEEATLLMRLRQILRILFFSFP